MKLLTTTALGLSVAIGLAAATVAPQEREGIAIGATPTFKFRRPLINGMGVKTLADLKGKPTLIDFWGTK